MMEFQSKYLGINERYWTYIMENLFKDGYISGIVLAKPWGEETMITDLERCMITPKGIEYLTDNGFMKKAVEFLKNAKSIVPFV